jgi:hypothetical protein
MNKLILQIVFPLVILAVLAMAIFGFSVMSEPGHVMAGCFGTTPGASCSMLSPIEHFEAHLHAFQSMTTAVTQTFSLLAALLLSITALIFLFIQQIDNAPRGIPILPRGDDVINSQKSRITHWLTLHEKRDPSLFAGAVNN